MQRRIALHTEMPADRAPFVAERRFVRIEIGT